MNDKITEAINEYNKRITKCEEYKETDISRVALLKCELEIELYKGFIYVLWDIQKKQAIT